MHHRVSPLRAVVAALLFALGALCTAGVASLTSSSSDRPAVGGASARLDAEPRPDGLAPRAAIGAKSVAHTLGSHVDVVAVLTALVVGALLLFGWLATRDRRRVPAPVALGALGARGPPALV